jgi:hypothetical protein
MYIYTYIYLPILLSEPFSLPLHQVVLTLAGNVTTTGTTRFSCPTASYFKDELKGLYGPQGSYPVWFSGVAHAVSHCWTWWLS